MKDYALSNQKDWKSKGITIDKKTSGCPDCDCDYEHKQGKCCNPNCPVGDNGKCRTYAEIGLPRLEDE